MKLYLIILFSFLTFVNVSGQTKALSFEVNGLKVILRPTEKETVSMAMFYRGGVMNYESKQAGIENLALASAALCGTKNYSVHDYEELADEYGIAIRGSSDTDYGTIRMNCISKYVEQGWKLFSDAVMYPIFDQTEFQNTKDKMVSAIYQNHSDPETRIERMSMQALFHGTPYSMDPLGTDSLVNSYTTTSVKDYYYNQLLNKNRMFLVVAGKITKEELEKKITTTFAALPAKPYQPAIYLQKEISGERLITEQRNIATNYMSCLINAPVMSSPDFHSFVLVINALSGNLNYEIRTKQALSYAPGATIKTQQMPYASMYVSTTQPKKSYLAMVDVFKNIRAGRYSQRFLDAIKKDHRFSYYSHQESSSTIVKDLGEAEVLGDFRMEENMVANINNVTLQSMGEAFNKYFKGAMWVYLGDEQLGRSVFQ